MVEAHWLLFLLASVVVIGTPGQDTLLALGVVFAALTFLIKGPVAVFAGRLSTGVQARPAALVGLYRFSGLVMLGLAVRLALSRREA